MCGIFGLVTSVALSADDQRIGAAKQALAHRGPDSSGSFVDAFRGTYCLMVHTRLAIQDLSPGGHQPMSTADGRYTIVLNGEIYNFKDIRVRLQSAGVRLRSTSDTEVVLEAYAAWGDACLKELRGMFAFAIWDRLERRVFFARDRLGVKPIYYVETPTGIAFSSELRALLQTNCTTRRLNVASIDTYLTFGSVVEPQTILQGVYAIPAGYCGTYADGNLELTKYWQLDCRTDDTANADAAREEVRSLLKESVRLRLVADVPVGVFLSGGMDSTAILALARMNTRADIDTFNIAFDESEYSEASYATEVARHFGCRHHNILLSTHQVADQLGSAFAAMDQPSCDGTNTYFVSQAVRETGAKVAMSGIGGDEVFAGYPGFARIARQVRVGTYLRGAQPMLRWLERHATSFRLGKFATLAAAAGSGHGTYAANRTVFSLGQRRGLIPSCVAQYATAHQSEQNLAISTWLECGGDPIAAYSLFEISNYLKNTLLRDTDVHSMAHGLEVREPLLDHLLIEKVVALPARLKLDTLQNKPLLASSVPELPVVATTRTKMGFWLPYDLWLRGVLRSWACELFSPRAIAAVGVLDVGATSKIWSDFEARRSGIGFPRLFTLLALIAWCRRHSVSA